MLDERRASMAPHRKPAGVTLAAALVAQLPPGCSCSVACTRVEHNELLAANRGLSPSAGYVEEVPTLGISTR